LVLGLSLSTLSLICFSLFLGGVVVDKPFAEWTWLDYSYWVMVPPCSVLSIGILFLGAICGTGAVAHFTTFLLDGQSNIARSERSSLEYSCMLGLLSLACLFPGGFMGQALLTNRADWSWSQVSICLLAPLCTFSGACFSVVITNFVRDWPQERAKRRRHLLKQVEDRIRAGKTQTALKDFRQVQKLLADLDSQVSANALETLAQLVQVYPELRESLEPSRALIEKLMLPQLGFLTAVKNRGYAPLAKLVTLGGKVGAGSGYKRIAPATTEPEMLAAWIVKHRTLAKSREVQVSVGYDTGTFPAQEQRGKFIALFLFIASTELKAFQALTYCPRRDPGAAYGLLIRGLVVQAKYSGQTEGKRLDYIFTLSPEMSESNLSVLLRQIQLLNLGMLLATAEDAHAVFFTGTRPASLDDSMSRLAEVYRNFERRFLRLLRTYDDHRQQAFVHPLDPKDHRERVAAFAKHRLEASLYPQYQWLIPLFSDDRKWDQLLPALRGLEGMMLHQGPVEDSTLTRGNQFIRDVRNLGFDVMHEIEEVLLGGGPPLPDKVRRDPFIDAQHEAATWDYLRKVGEALVEKRVSVNHLPDPDTFFKAAAYYGLPIKEALASGRKDALRNVARPRNRTSDDS